MQFETRTIVLESYCPMAKHSGVKTDLWGCLGPRWAILAPDGLFSILVPFGIVSMTLLPCLVTNVNILLNVRLQ